MNKSGLLSLCCLILLISIIATGCVLERYIKIEENNGITTFLDSASISYSKETDIATFTLKAIPNKATKAKWAEDKHSNNIKVNPYLEADYLLYANKIKISKRKLSLGEMTFMDNKKRIILKIPRQGREKWEPIEFAWMEKIYQEVAKRI